MNAASLYNLVTSTAPITSLVGNIDPRIFWNIKPQNELRSCLVLVIPDELIGQSLSGPDGYENANVQVTCFAPTYAQARELALVVSVELDGQEIDSQAILTVESRQDVAIVPAEGQATPLMYAVVVNLSIET